jgi:single-strand DNA-binding protein
MNLIILQGRMVRDGELTQSQSGTTIYKNVLAVNRQFKKDGKDEADFFKIIAFGKTAEFMSKYTAKGLRGSVKGRVEMGSYDKDGQKVYTTTVVVEDFFIIDWKDKTQIEVPEGYQVEGDENLPF